jgi:hypothetical protein
MASTAALKTFTVTDAVLQLADLNQFHIFDILGFEVLQVYLLYCNGTV